MQGVTHKQLITAKKRNRKLRKILGDLFGAFASEQAITEDLRRMALQGKKCYWSPADINRINLVEL